MMVKFDTWPTDKLLDRWLNPVQTKALRDLAQEENLSDDMIRTLAQITGRGYRPPTTVDGWREMLDLLKRIGVQDD
jgi:hypothetical protein